MLSAQNLAKNFKGRDVVKDVSIEICQSQIVGLLGPGSPEEGKQVLSGINAGLQDG